MIRILILPCLLLLILGTPAGAQQPTPSPAGSVFEIKEGDRVLLLGDGLLEREDSYGILETRMIEQFRDRRFTVRNLSWSGDTPLGVSRASFDKPSKGWERLQEQIAMVRPTVAILGFGMAASLQALAEQSKDIMFNPDPARYGREPMTPARLKAELAQLMDEIAKPREGGTGPVRFILLSPIRHEDHRASRPGMPDPARHEELLAGFGKAIEELAQERGARFLSLRGELAEKLTANGIHPTEEGFAKLWSRVGAQLGWTAASETPQTKAVRETVNRKNLLFFHRWRPQNYTYLFGFRKHEQGQNAKEIPQFDPLIAQLEQEIEQLKHDKAAPAPASLVPSAGSTPLAASAPAPVPAAAPLPTFDVLPGYEIALWATNPLLEKPIQMNWDADGRLWIASSSTYPQVSPEDVAAMLAKDIAAKKTNAPSAGNDRIIVVESSVPGGPPDKSIVFADGLLIPSGVAPFRTPQGHWGCYVGQSTELLELVDTDGDMRADKRRVILSGFGTEDTHHLIHTLKWGPDGRLYFNQSIYIHSHLETPHGLVRLNSGGVLSWDPRTERVEVLFKGFCNPWGHVWDNQGQSFITDGAGFQGISWGVPGAMYFTYENGRKILQSVSPGTYPKFCSLEYIRSPHFPADWQGSFVTCDFRAHRIVHFGMNDLSKSDPPQSGFITTELPDLVRTSDISFRPIDVRLGPDGALYVADWSNPVINHGEVDFRDPRRDKHQGRIWKITRKGAPLLPWQKLSGKLTDDLRKHETSANAWERDQAVQALSPSWSTTFPRLRATQARAYGEYLTQPGHASKMAAASGGDVDITAEEMLARLEQLSRDASPRVRLEAMRSYARLGTVRAADAILNAALNAPANDPYYEYASWLSINDLAEPWTRAVLAGEWKIDSPQRERQLEFALNALEPPIAGPVLAKVLQGREIPADGSGPWIDLIGRSGGAPELGRLLTLLTAQKLSPAASEKVLVALREAMRLRALKPQGDLAAVEPLLSHDNLAISANAARLIGVWKTSHASTMLRELAGGGTRSAPPELRVAAIEGLRDLGGADSIATLRLVSAQRPAQGLPREAAVALAALDLRGSISQIVSVLGDLPQEREQLDTWRAILASSKGAPDQLANLITKGGAAQFSQPLAASGLRVARELGRPGQKLAAALGPIAGVQAAASAPTDYTAIAASVKRDGDPARGEEVYRRANLACVTCHAIGGAGGKVGPELTSMGASAPLDYIIESVVAPAAKVKEGYHALSVTMKDGTGAVGVLSRETGQELYLRNVVGQETAVVKANIAARETVGSIMPAGLIDQLKNREQIDLYAFLGQLGKPGVYDASKGNIARYWALYPAAALDAYVKGTPLPQGAAPGFTLVDGRLTRELLKASLDLMPDAGDTIAAAARFQLPTAGKVSLQFTGASTIYINGVRIDGGQASSLTQPAGVQPAAPTARQLDLPAGEHVVVVQLDPKQLPEALRLQCDQARFLGN